MTTNRHNLLILVVSVVIAASFWIFPLHKNRNASIRYKLFKTESGWGYDILIHDTLHIRQEYMPVLSEKRSFPKQVQAQRAAALVIQKLRAGHSPAIDRSELQAICPATDPLYGSKREPE